MSELQEVAKFVSGVLAWESFTHLSLLLSRQEPVVLGIRLSRRLNIVQTILPGALAVAAAWWAWS